MTENNGSKAESVKTVVTETNRKLTNERGRRSDFLN